MAVKSRVAKVFHDTKPRRLTTLQWLFVLILSLAALLAAATWVWWGAIQESLMDPGVPYQTYVPPPPPDYTQRAAWALLPPSPSDSPTEAPPADVFFIHPTTYQGREWNAPADDAEARALLEEVMLPNYAGPFAEVGRVFAPYYRQASLYTQMTLREDAREARAYAYKDIQRAFGIFLTVRDPSRPFFIVGVEQGGLLATRLAKEAVVEAPNVRERLVAVYLIETATPATAFPRGALLAPCERRSEAGCVVGYLAEPPGEERLIAERLRHAPRWRAGMLVPLRDEPLLCVNPVLGVATDQAAGTEANLGAADASGLEWGAQPGVQAHQVAARCEGGVLRVSRPRSASLRGRNGWIGAQRVRPHNWFYADLAADAEARLEALGAGSASSDEAPR